MLNGPLGQPGTDAGMIDCPHMASQLLLRPTYASQVTIILTKTSLIEDTGHVKIKLTMH